MAFFQWLKVMLSMSTLFAYCYIQNVTATFDMFFVDIWLGVVYNYRTFLKIRTMIGLLETHPPTPP